MSELREFLSEELFSFVNDNTDSPSTSSHAYQDSSNNSDINSLLLQAIENYESSNESASLTTRSFANPVTSRSVEQAIKRAIHESTRKDTKYCVDIWDEWIADRAKNTGTIIPYLKDITVTELQHRLCYFILEVRKRNGAEFPPNSLHHICCGILRYLRINGMRIDIFKDKEFSKFRNVLDSEMKRLQTSGLGAQQRKAEVISYESEDIMWEKGILGDGNRQGLLDTMLFMNILYFALQGGRDHRLLQHKLSLLKNQGKGLIWYIKMFQKITTVD